MSKYLPLSNWLSNQAAFKPTVHCVFDEIENLIGSTLPSTARKNAAWWSNNANRHVQANAWLNAGFKTDSVDLEKESVTFIRIG